MPTRSDKVIQRSIKPYNQNKDPQTKEFKNLRTLVLSWIRQTEESQKNVVLQQISQMGSRAIEEIEKLLECEHSLTPVRQEKKEGYLLSLLAMLGQDKYIPKLVYLQGTKEWRPRGHFALSCPMNSIEGNTTIVTQVLISRGKKSIPSLVRELKKPHGWNKIMVPYVLGMIGDSEALPYLGAYLIKNPEELDSGLYRPCRWAVAKILCSGGSVSEAEQILGCILTNKPIPEDLRVKNSSVTAKMIKWWKEMKK